MSTPGKSQRLPKPASDVRGANNLEPAGQSFEDTAKLYKPANVGVEPPKATVSRYALRLINQETGEAFSADEIAPTAENILEVLQGEAGDPDRIGAEYMPEVFPAIIELVDPSPDTPAAGQITGGPDQEYIYLGGKQYRPIPFNNISIAIAVPNKRVQGAVKNLYGEHSITQTGNLSVTVTSATNAISEVVSVAVLEGDAPANWMPKVADAINANSNITAKLDAYATGGVMQVQANDTTTSDHTVVIANGTAAGLSGSGLTGNGSTQRALIEVGRFTIPAADAVAETKFFIAGNIYVTESGAGGASTIHIGFMPEDGIRNFLTMHTKVTNFSLTQRADFAFSSLISVNSPAKLVDNSGDIYLTIDEASTVVAGGIVEIVKDGSDAVESIKTLTPAAPGLVGAVDFAPGVEKEIIMLLMPQINTTASGLTIGGFIRFNKSTW